MANTDNSNLRSRVCHWNDFGIRQLIFVADTCTETAQRWPVRDAIHRDGLPHAIIFPAMVNGPMLGP